MTYNMLQYLEEGKEPFLHSTSICQAWFKAYGSEEGKRGPYSHGKNDHCTSKKKKKIKYAKFKQ